MRDHTGLVQCVVDGAHALRSEYVVARRPGRVRHRPEGTVNPSSPTGEVELGDCAVEILAEAEPPPFPIDGRVDADEAVRLRYRYLDLRSERMQANLRLRAAVNSRAARARWTTRASPRSRRRCCGRRRPRARASSRSRRACSTGSFYVLPQ